MKRIIHLYPCLCTMILFAIIISLMDCTGSGSGSSSGSDSEHIDWDERTPVEPGEVIKTNTITLDGIRFEFFQEVSAGIFANGDYWVLGPVQIVEMYPRHKNGNNGWEVNPGISGEHSFQIGCYGNELYNDALTPPMPYNADPSNGSVSIVKVIYSGGHYPCVLSAAVLTVVKEIPPGNGREVFRPPYVGDDKPYYHVSDIRTDLLPEYEPVSGMPSLDKIESDFSSLLLDHRGGALSRGLRPIMSMYSYQPANTQVQNDAALRLMMNDPIAEKMPALIHYLQFGIDQIHAMLMGQTWPSGGGHETGRRLPFGLTAVLLEMEDVIVFLREADFFHGTSYFYVGKNNIALWGSPAHTTERNYWGYIESESGGRSQKDPYEIIDGGNPLGIGYQTITSQGHKGEMLATHMMPVLKDTWNIDEWNRMRDYTDRWVMHGLWTLPDPYAPYDGNTGNYGETYGPDSNTGIPIAGEGRFVSGHGLYRDNMNKTAGAYKSAFVLSLWTTYRSYAETPPFGIIIHPYENETVSGTLDVAVTAFGVHGVSSVQLLINGVLTGEPVTSPSEYHHTTYRLCLNTEDYSEGSLFIAAVITDESGNTSTTADVELDVNN